MSPMSLIPLNHWSVEEFKGMRGGKQRGQGNEWQGNKIQRAARGIGNRESFQLFVFDTKINLTTNTAIPGTEPDTENAEAGANVSMPGTDGFSFPEKAD